MYRVAISPGHHVFAKGASFEGFTEFPNTSYWADEIVKLLVAQGVDALKIKPQRLPLKIQQIQELNAEAPLDLAVEVHFNSAVGARGCETLYYPGSDKGYLAASCVQDQLATIYHDRGVKEGWYKMDRPGVVDYQGDVEGDETPDYFLLKTPCPAIILEPEFVQNKDLILETKVKACRAIRDGIINYLESND